MNRLNWPLAVLLVIHILVGLGFNVITPIFEAPDEDGHYLFVRYLQLHRELPVQTLNPNGPRAHHPPLYHLLGALLTAWTPIQGGADRIDMRVNPHVWFRYDDPETDNKAYWIHYGPEERWPYQGQALAIHLGRLLSLAFSALGVLLTYKIALRLRPGDAAFASLATGLVAFHPMLLFMTGVLQNNTTMLASGAAILYVLTWAMQTSFTLGRWLLLGLLLSIGMLLQLSALTLAAPVALALLYEALRTQRLRTLWEGGLGVVIPLIALTGWWFLRNRMLYGSWSGNNVIQQLWCCDPIQPWPALYLFLTGLLGRLGQGLMITYPRPVYIGAALIALVALAGLAAWSLGRLRMAGLALNGQSLRGLKWLTPGVQLWSLHLLTVAAVLGALVWFAITVAPGLPGRYVFPAFPSLGLLLAAGLLFWVRPLLGSRDFPYGKSGCPYARAVIVFLALELGVTLYGMFGLLWPTYAMPRSPSPAELRQMTPLDADIGSTARVLGYRLSQEIVKPGEPLDVTIYWRPETRTDVPYTVFVHLYDPGAGSLAQRDTYPGLGTYATTVWDPGRPFVDTYRLRLPTDAPLGSHGMILLGLYDETTMQRLPVTGANAGPAEESWVEFGDIQIQP